MKVFSVPYDSGHKGLRVIALARERFELAALVVASYDPSCDPEGKIAAIGARIVRSVA